ncbi:LysM peptidoglycan-binding domain-containing protein [uncultured Lacinutrix sp.]|uniref:LysM peptidoglycan-binding domain-containing protein n=1 Tax=uncultured Lacinutrix sp. TaxID=574032 RepID=UPI0026335CEC|nr:LysM peptidoglycan-binding domain-containing protein [uncultured Lacinutrix sp.]
MKTITITVFCLLSMTVISQNNMVDVTIDDRPAKMNMATGEYKFTGKKIKPSKTTIENNVIDNLGDSSTDIHVVKKGETLYAISKQYGVSMAQIKSVNNLSTNLLKIGQELTIGYSNTRILSTSASYTVAKGDTLYSISKHNNISVTQLKTLNGLSSNLISIGQVLKLK